MLQRLSKLWQFGDWAVSTNVPSVAPGEVAEEQSDAGGKSFTLGSRSPLRMSVRGRQGPVGSTDSMSWGD